MPTLTIDNQEITVPEGTNVLEAAKDLGIVIPHFCYHEALGAVGACRLCAMAFVEGPVKGIQMSCMVEAKDGMVVSTLDEQAREQRAHVIEWLMVNHPHDCPVCDEGGECQLQDMTIAGGHSIRRYRGKKRTYVNQHLGPFIEQEMNRCIQCYRCVRTYQDYCGGDDFGVLGSRDRLFFGRFREGRLLSPFSGNIVDVCPTGVFTDKTFRFKTRYWDLQEAPSVCPHCSLGCATIPGGRYRELQRVRAGVNPRTNGFFICDRGRFGYDHVNHPQRPRQPQLDGRECRWSEAIASTKARLAELKKEHGSGSIAFLGSGRASLEGQYLLRRWAKSLGSDRIAFESIARRDRSARVLAAGLGDRAASLEEVRASDFILLVGADPLAEGPMAALAVRQAVRAGATVAVLDPRPVQLPCSGSHLPLTPEKLTAALDALSRGDLSAFERQQGQILEGIVARLKQARRPVLIGGADFLGPGGVSALLAAADRLNETQRPCKAMVLLNGPNSFGGALLAEDGVDFELILQGMEAGEIKALVCLEADPLGELGETLRLRDALANLSQLVVIDALPTATSARAGIFLPATATAETAGTFVNNEGRMLAFESVIEPGLPIAVTGGGDHPPRVFEMGTPGGEPRPAWAILDALQTTPRRSLMAVRREIQGEDERFAGLATLEGDGEGRRITAPATSLEDQSEPCEPAGGLRLIATEALFGTELLSSLSRPMATAVEGPSATLHPSDASALDFADGGQAILEVSDLEMAVTVRHCATMAKGIVLVPRLYGSTLRLLVPGEAVPCRLRGKGEA